MSHMSFCCITALRAGEQHAFILLSCLNAQVHLCSWNSALSLTMWKPDAVNTFPDGGTEEAYIFLFCKVQLPKINCSVLSCCSFTTSVSVKMLSELKGLFIQCETDVLLTCLDSHCFCHTGKKWQKAAFVPVCLKKFLSNQGIAQGEEIGKILLPVFVLNFLVWGRSRLVRKQYANILGDTILGWRLN